ncbi:hypothetical protein TVAG_170430 [Trichomonas vaginalis G3]|uniref:receptor protein-tyrosine kinase n=1 Tax=Trichomonas vaginalis (strain ATCC PRA-98 / G3) TaxID=412133 RepID=A2DPI5_TRIV3|nr:glycine-rich protein family [Trichomonas vaginalis G3]EAY17729.1 hypothetical protein TVAG_170430 [Trichomonas vaginalis G3]KAI5507867.1 glycine-rich protein family [Trichomonas vaginalis G3]|eukprot:XP_001329864.1 hypothetical protein [Trichomonas vaginalis G3]
MDSWKLGSKIGDLGKYASNGTVATFNYPCSNTYECTYYHSILPPGYYKVEVWGAEGGNTIYCSKAYTHENKKGGYSVGVLKLNKSSEVYVFVGGKGQDAIYPQTGNRRGGFNGGGDTASDGKFDEHGGAGGGATDIRVDGIALSNRMIVAGGAGGLGFDFHSCSLPPESWGGGIEAGRPMSWGPIFGTPATQSKGNANGAGSAGQLHYFGSSGGGGGGYFGGTLPPYSDSYAGSAGGGSGYIGKVISFNGIIAQSIPGNQSMPSPDNQVQTIGREGNGAARITNLGYFLQKTSTLNDSYDPNSIISIDFSLNTLGAGEIATIKRSINTMNQEETILTHNDDGNEYIYTDSFRLPEETGFLKIIYKVTSKSGITTSTFFDILVNKKPEINVIGRPKEKYVPTEKAFVEIEVVDDTYVNVTIKGEANILYTTEIINCYHTKNRTRLEFKIGPFTIGSKHNLYISGVDEYGFSTVVSNFQYVIVNNVAPDLRVDSNLTYHFSGKDKVKINGEFLDKDGAATITIFSKIDNSLQVNHGAQSISDLEWHTFNITRDMSDVRKGIHTLTVFAVDDNDAESNKYVHYFALFSGYCILNKPSCYCLYRGTWVLSMYFPLSADLILSN